MFLTAPTIQELQELDMPTLMQMLAYQTKVQFDLEATEPMNSSVVLSSKDLLYNIQAVIEMKKNATSTSISINFTRDSTQPDHRA
jgi:hypothetical protein